jgi:hypothetical protein
MVGLVAVAVLANAAPQARSELADEVVESRIDGDFNGWDGETVFPLQNGQVWQQAAPGVLVAVRVQPKVRIYKSKGSWWLHVDGVDREVRVRRVK